MPDYIWMYFPLIVTMCIIIFAPISLAKVNSKRAAKNKPALTEAEFEKKIKKERIIAVSILVVSFVIATLITEFA